MFAKEKERGREIPARSIEAKKKNLEHRKGERRSKRRTPNSGCVWRGEGGGRGKKTCKTIGWWFAEAKISLSAKGLIDTSLVNGEVERLSRDHGYSACLLVVDALLTFTSRSLFVQWKHNERRTRGPENRFEQPLEVFFAGTKCRFP